MARRAPTLYRVSQLLQLAGTLVLVGLVIFLATAAYSAAHLRPEVGSGGGSAALEANGTVVVTESVNLSNQGFYAISPLSVALQIRSTSGGLLGEGGSPSLTIAPGATSSLPFDLWLPLSGSARSLATQDAQLPVGVWINATYASIFVIHLNGTFNYSWGAPLANLNATPGTPMPQPNGTVLVTVAVSFNNHAPFADVGTVTFTVRTSTGTTCGTGSLAVNVPGGSSFNQQLSYYAGAGCNPSGGTVTGTYTGNGLTVALPTEAIP